jgi:hypothetical protein
MTDKAIEAAAKALLNSLSGEEDFGGIPMPDTVDAVRAAIAAYHAAAPSAWQPIETAPRDGERIVLAKYDWAHGLSAFGPSDVQIYGLWWMTVGYWSDKWLNWNDGIEPSGLASPTHWMPLPEPPK